MTPATTTTEATDVSDAMITGIIDAMPMVFDSHAVIRELMRKYPQRYVTALYGHVANLDPIQTFHSKIGTRLGEVATIERTKRVSSQNVRGESTENQEWKKR